MLTIRIRSLTACVLLVALGCGKPATPAPPSGPAATTCRSADDCALSNLRSEDDCCGDPCDASQPYHRDQLAALQLKQAAACANKDVECPQADCDRPRNLYPGCDHGTCVAIELPRRTPCTADEQCVLSCYEPASCCGSCDCGTPWHRDDLARAETWRSEQCASAECPMKKCAAPTAVARCEKGWCVAK